MAKHTYRIRNWSEYNKALINRGSVTLWVDQALMQQWEYTNRPTKRGRPQQYTDTLIHCALTLKVMYKLTYRAVQGFMQSLLKLMHLDLSTPHYSLLCKRQSQCAINLPANPTKQPIHLVVDTTGLKIYGEGEWKCRKHGITKKRLWRKIHLAIDASTQNIMASEVTELGVQDCQGLLLILEKIHQPIGDCIGDGAYDRFSCYELAKQKRFHLIAPPQHNAKTSTERSVNKKKASIEAVQSRDDTIKRCRAVGRAQWKIETGYHRRSLAETAMARMKRLLGNSLSGRSINSQKIEVAIRCHIINKMTALGMPDSIALR